MQALHQAWQSLLVRRIQCSEQCADVVRVNHLDGFLTCLLTCESASG